MDMIKFELPEILWKVTRAYLTNDVPSQYLFEIISQEKSYYFKDHNLAQEFCDSFSDVEIIEPIEQVESTNALSEKRNDLLSLAAEMQKSRDTFVDNIDKPKNIPFDR